MNKILRNYLKSTYRLNRAMAIVILAVPVFWVAVSQVQASSHRESPIIVNSYDETDDTDFYVFISYNADGKESLNVVAQFPSIGSDGSLNVIPIGVNSGEQTLYTIYIDDNGDANSDYAVSINLTALSNAAGTETIKSSSSDYGPGSVASNNTTIVALPDCPEPGQLAIEKIPLRIDFDPETGKFNLARRQAQAATKVSLEIPASCVTAGGRNLSVWSTSSQLVTNGAIGVSRPDASASNVQQISVTNKAIEKTEGVDGGSLRGTL